MAKKKRTKMKQKTRKAIAKRVKITATGKVLRLRAGKRHLLTGKSRKRKRSLGRWVPLSAADMRRVKNEIAR